MLKRLLLGRVALQRHDDVAQRRCSVVHDFRLRFSVIQSQNSGAQRVFGTAEDDRFVLGDLGDVGLGPGDGVRTSARYPVHHYVFQTVNLRRFAVYYRGAVALLSVVVVAPCEYLLLQYLH